MTEMTDTQISGAPFWRSWATLAWTIGLIGVMVVAQGIGAIFAIPKILGRMPPVEEFLQMAPELATHGTLLTYATIASFIALVPSILMVIKIKERSRIADYLALVPAKPMDYLKWTAITLGAVIALGLLGQAVGKSTADQFTADVVRTAPSTFLLFFAVAFCAPVLEELLFRGFAYKGLSNGPLRPLGTIILTAAVFGSLHVQYEWFDMMTTFVIGVLLGLARWKTGSIYVPIFVHVVNNALALALVTAS